MNTTTLRTTRLCAALGLALATLGAQAAADTTRVIVSFKNTEAASVRQAVARLGGVTKVDLAHINAIAVEVPSSRVAQLSKLAGVASVEVDAKRYLDPMVRAAATADEADAAMAATAARLAPMAKPITRQRMPYGIKMVQGKNVPKINAAPVMVCIIDSGLDSTHPDLDGVQMSGASDGGAGDWNGFPLFPHGTHVAGTIAAVDNDTGVIGVAGRGEVSLYNVRVFNSLGNWTYASDLAAATQQCKAAGAKVISMSLRGLTANSAERENFAQLERDGILSVAAAGNDGMAIKAYPASYSSVISVAAIDKDRAWASFSNRAAEVELAAPGVNVASTMPVGAGGLMSSVRQAGTGYSSIALEGSPETGIDTPVVAATYDFGFGDKVDAGAAGKSCLISRGTIAFSEKVLNCQASGGVSAVIYNNVAGNFNGTLNGVATTIPSASVSDVDGAALKAGAPAPTKMMIATTDYGYMTGTSMSTPHVAGVAAKLWRLHPDCTNTQIRDSLDKSAVDLDAAGRDVKTGFGLVQLRAAHERITAMGCGV